MTDQITPTCTQVHQTDSALILKLSSQLKIALKAMNTLAIAQSGAMDYTTDFYELCKTEIRYALGEIEGLERLALPDIYNPEVL